MLASDGRAVLGHAVVGRLERHFWDEARLDGLEQSGSHGGLEVGG